MCTLVLVSTSQTKIPKVKSFAAFSGSVGPQRTCVITPPVDFFALSTKDWVLPSTSQTRRQRFELDNFICGSSGIRLAFSCVSVITQCGHYHLRLVIPPHNKVVGGVYWFHSIRSSVRPSVHPSRILCPLCSAYSSGWIHFIFTHLIKQLQKMCRM